MMTTEQVLLEKWRALPPLSQQEVIDFVEFLESKQAAKPTEDRSQSRSSLGVRGASPLETRLRKIRAEIVASGEPLLDWEGVEREKANRRASSRGAMHCAPTNGIPELDLPKSRSIETPI